MVVIMKIHCLLRSLLPYMQPEAADFSLLLKFENQPVGWKGHHLLRSETKIFLPPVVGRIVTLQKCPLLNHQTSHYVMSHSKGELRLQKELSCQLADLKIRTLFWVMEVSLMHS